MISSIEVVNVLEDAGSLLALRLAGLPLLTVSTVLPGVPQHACMCSLVCTCICPHAQVFAVLLIVVLTSG